MGCYSDVIHGIKATNTSQGKDLLVVEEGSMTSSRANRLKKLCDYWWSCNGQNINLSKQKSKFHVGLEWGNELDQCDSSNKRRQPLEQLCDQLCDCIAIFRKIRGRSSFYAIAWINTKRLHSVKLWRIFQILQDLLYK